MELAQFIQQDDLSLIESFEELLLIKAIAGHRPTLFVPTDAAMEAILILLTEDPAAVHTC